MQVQQCAEIHVAERLRAVVADLRRAQSVLQEWTGSSCPETEYGRRLAEVGASVALRLSSLAYRLEVELDSWQERSKATASPVHGLATESREKMSEEA